MCALVFVLLVCLLPFVVVFALLVTAVVVVAAADAAGMLPLFLMFLPSRCREIFLAFSLYTCKFNGNWCEMPDMQSLFFFVRPRGVGWNDRRRPGGQWVVLGGWEVTRGP